MNTDFLLLNLEHKHLDHNWNWKNVSSPFARIFFITEGRAYLHFDNAAVELLPGNAYVIPPYVNHSYECPQTVTMFYLHIYDKTDDGAGLFDTYDFPQGIPVDSPGFRPLLESMCARFPNFKLEEIDPSKYDNKVVLASFVKRYECLPQPSRMYLSGAVQVILSELLPRAIPKKWTSDRRMANALGYIFRNISAPISTSALAREACMSEGYFNREFKKTFGMSPQKYITVKKIEKARSMLLMGGMPVSEIAVALGFYDSPHFVRSFKAVTGISPSKYRRNAKPYYC